jgi:hypothetical protein
MSKFFITCLIMLAGLMFSNHLEASAKECQKSTLCSMVSQERPPTSLKAIISQENHKIAGIYVFESQKVALTPITVWRLCLPSKNEVRCYSCYDYRRVNNNSILNNNIVITFNIRTKPTVRNHHVIFEPKYNRVNS